MPKKIQEYESYWEAKKRYRATKAQLSMQIDPEDKERIRDHANRYRNGNITGYVMDAVRERMEREDAEKKTEWKQRRRGAILGGFHIFNQPRFLWLTVG